MEKEMKELIEANETEMNFEELQAILQSEEDCELSMNSWGDH
ncbi:hypothetical protein [Clostridium taeniosporum]|nr:hypothetical protein [Clostridium taeniosporum]